MVTPRVHQIVVGVKPTTNIQVIMDRVMNNLKKNMEDEKGNFTQFITTTTKKLAQDEAKLNQFRGDLWRGIAMRFFKKSGRGEVFIRSTQAQKAIMNEFGQTPPRLVPNVGKIRQWAERKAPHLLNRRKIPVGFPGTGSHVIAPNPINRFWGITANRINANMTRFFAKYLENIIRKS